MSLIARGKLAIFGEELRVLHPLHRDDRTPISVLLRLSTLTVRTGWRPPYAGVPSGLQRRVVATPQKPHYLADRERFMNLDLDSIGRTSLGVLAVVGLKILGATILWFIGRRLIRFASNLAARALRRAHLDPTAVGYIKASIGAILTIVLVVALMGFFGVETTSFAALLAGAGIAIGVAWSGLLSNFAAGIFLVVLRPFQVGDFVCAAGVTGTVTAISLFVTTIDTPENVLTFVGNGKIFADTIQNFSANPYRRVDLTAQLPHGADPNIAIGILKGALNKVPGVFETPAPEVEILQFNLAGPVLAVRPYCSNANYWPVYFATNRVIRECFVKAGYPVPEKHFLIREQTQPVAEQKFRASA
jgi:small conductance mechanosensitive channel